MQLLLFCKYNIRLNHSFFSFPVELFEHTREKEFLLNVLLLYQGVITRIGRRDGELRLNV